MVVCLGTLLAISASHCKIKFKIKQHRKYHMLKNKMFDAPYSLKSKMIRFFFNPWLPFQVQ